MVQKYYESDVDPRTLEGKTIAVVGYGSQGRGQALNLRDSGCRVVIGLRPGKSWQKASEDGFEVYSVAEAVKRADVVQILLPPDENQGAIYRAEISPNIRENACLMFSHGFNIHYGQIVPPRPPSTWSWSPPKAPPAIWSAGPTRRGGRASRPHRRPPGRHGGRHGPSRSPTPGGIGATRAVVLETTFAEETETDLFGEQAVLCGGVTSLIKAGFETLVDAGYAPEMAYLEVLHEMKLIVDLIYEGGFTKMRDSISNTAQYGDLTRGPPASSGPRPTWRCRRSSKRSRTASSRRSGCLRTW